MPEVTTNEVQNYQDLTTETILQIQADAKKMDTKAVGLPTPDSIQYYEVDEKLKIGDKDRLSFIAATTEVYERETGEKVVLPMVLLVDGNGSFWKNGTTMMVQHFAQQQSGYQAEITYKGLKKTKGGRNMQVLEFRPLK